MMMTTVPKGDLVGLFSGGKDSLTACLVSGVKEVVYSRTGVGLNEEYVKEMCEKLSWKLNIVVPYAKLEYEEFCIRYGFPRPESHTWIMQRLKLNPIKRWHRTESKKGRDIIFVSGIRLKESKRRRMNFSKDDKLTKVTGIRFHKPILNWSKDDVSNYIKSHNLPLSPTYKTLGLGGDCLCGAFTKREHTQILNDNYPELAERIKELEKECRGHWGQFMSLTDCQGQRKLDSLVCNECISGESD